MVPTASGRTWGSQISTATSLKSLAAPKVAISAGFKKTANGTSRSQPISAPEKSTAEMRGPTMKPTPASIGETDGEDLLEKLKGSDLPLKPIEQIKDEVEALVGGPPEPPRLTDKPVAVVKWVDGTVLDTVWQVEE